MKKAIKSKGIQRKRTSAKRVTLQNLLRDADEHFNYDVFLAAISASCFRNRAEADEVLDTLLRAHNAEPSKPRYLGNPWLTPAFQVRRGSLDIALSYLVDRESLGGQNLLRLPNPPIATVTLRDPPFSMLKPFTLGSEGLLYDLVKAAQSLVYVHDCTVEAAIESCMRGILPTGLLPDPMAVKAADFVRSTYPVSAAIGELQKELKALPWNRIRKELRDLLASDLRAEITQKQERDPGPKLDAKEFPRFCHTENECKRIIIKAAMSKAYMYIKFAPAPPGAGGSIVWHSVPDIFGLRDAFSMGHLIVEPIGDLQQLQELAAPSPGTITGVDEPAS